MTIRRRLHCAALSALALATAAGLPANAAEDDVTAGAFESLTAIRASAEGYVRAQLGATRGVARVSAAALDARLHLARCAAPLHAQLPSGFALQARATVGVSCEAPMHWTLYVPVSVERHIDVLILRHALERDAFLSRDDVSIESRTVTGLDSAYLSDPAELHGRAARRTLAAGTALTVDMLTPNFLVRRGQDVVLLAGMGTFEVRAAGRALEDAPAGVRVKVQNMSSMRVVEGVAQSSGVVRVNP